MDSKRAVLEMLKWLTDSSFGKYSDSDDPLSSSFPKAETIVKTDNQVFPDHLLTAKRFQKTFYYGDLSSSNFHPPLALTDVTLELFNKTVPNEGRLDILDMDYASHVSKAISISPYSMILAMMYVDQLRHKNPDYLETVSPCDLYVVSMLVASKYLFDDDEYTYNYDWASIVNLDVAELNRLEKEFLCALNWELFIKPSYYSDFLTVVEQRIALKQSFDRGWLSYTDVTIIFEHRNFMQFWFQLSGSIIKVVVIVTLGYVTCVFLLLGASLLFKLAVMEMLLMGQGGVTHLHTVQSHLPMRSSANVSDLNILRCQDDDVLDSVISYKDLSGITSIKKSDMLLCFNEYALFHCQTNNFEWEYNNNVIQKDTESTSEERHIQSDSEKSTMVKVKKQEQNLHLNELVSFDNCVVLWSLYQILRNQSMISFRE